MSSGAVLIVVWQNAGTTGRGAVVPPIMYRARPVLPGIPEEELDVFWSCTGGGLANFRYYRAWRGSTARLFFVCHAPAAALTKIGEASAGTTGIHGKSPNGQIWWRGINTLLLA